MAAPHGGAATGAGSATCLEQRNQINQPPRGSAQRGAEPGALPVALTGRPGAQSLLPREPGLGRKGQRGAEAAAEPAGSGTLALRRRSRWPPGGSEDREKRSRRPRSRYRSGRAARRAGAPPGGTHVCPRTRVPAPHSPTYRERRSGDALRPPGFVGASSSRDAGTPGSAAPPLSVMSAHMRTGEAAVRSGACSSAARARRGRQRGADCESRGAPRRGAVREAPGRGAARRAGCRARPAAAPRARKW